MTTPRKILVCADLPASEIDNLLQQPSHDGFVDFLKHRLSFSDAPFPLSDVQIRIVCDLLALCVPFSRDQRFDASQTSTLLSIVKHVLFFTTTQNMTMEAAYEYAKQVLVRHSVFRPPFATNVFTLDGIVAIEHFMLENLFRFYKLYFFVFGQNEEVDFELVERQLLEPMPVLVPMREFVLEDEHIAKVKAEEDAKRAEQEAEEKKRKEEAAAQEAKAKAEQEAKEAEERNRTITVAEMQEHVSKLRGELTHMSSAQMDALESKLAALEARLGLQSS